MSCHNAQYRNRPQHTCVQGAVQTSVLGELTTGVRTWLGWLQGTLVGTVSVRAEGADNDNRAESVYGHVGRH